MSSSTKNVEMAPAQCRAARALLDWTQPRLASRAEVGLSTVVDFERARRLVSTEARAAIQRALESAGVEFTNGGEPGVKLRRPKDDFLSDELFGLLIQRFDRGDFAHLSRSLEKCPTGRPPEKLRLALSKSRATLYSSRAEIGRVDLEKGGLVFSPPLPGNYPSQVDIGKLWDWTMESWRRHNAIAELPRIVGLSILGK
jgi:transcriptional regulator with XRE-family HTH domain